MNLKLIKIILRLAFKIKKIIFGYGIFENVNGTNFSQNCLLIYIIDPFKKIGSNYRHQNYWQAKELSKTLKEFNYNVDVINIGDDKNYFKKKYSLVVNLHPGINKKYKKYLTSNHKEIFYCTGSNPEYLNKAERSRLSDLYKRKGVALKPRRQVKLLDKKDCENLAGMIFMGNEYNLKTYNALPIKQKYLISNTGYPFLQNNDFSAKSSKNFLFLSGSGQIHKGLDLLLEVFLKIPQINLYVCSNFAAEKDFEILYKKELYNTPNIFPIGLIDITSEKFKNISKKCAFIVAPSCSEGQSGSVLTGMSAGLIPIVSKDCGFNDTEAFILENCKIETIEKTLLMFSVKTLDWVENQSRKTMHIIKTNYNEKIFIKKTEEAFKKILI